MAGFKLIYPCVNFANYVNFQKTRKEAGRCQAFLTESGSRKQELQKSITSLEWHRITLPCPEVLSEVTAFLKKQAVGYPRGLNY
jgi:predicted secreted protein